MNVGAEPVFADIEPDTLNLDPAKAREALESGSIKAIVPVHLFGLPVDLDRFTDSVATFGVPVIQDAAQAFGSSTAGGRSAPTRTSPRSRSSPRRTSAGSATAG